MTPQSFAVANRIVSRAAMTDAQRIEWDYIRGERLGNLCPTGTPTAEQIAIAEREADAWVRQDNERKPCSK